MEVMGMGYRAVKALEQAYYVFRWRLLRWLDSLGAKRK
jgi:hypothetical protein